MAVLKDFNTSRMSTNQVKVIKVIWIKFRKFSQEMIWEELVVADSSRK
jgi:hypothetical protein